MGIMEAMDKPPSLKPLHWVGSSKRDLISLPPPVVDLFGFALYLAQDGKKHEQAKPLRGFGSAGVLEVLEDWDRSTYRAVYTVRFGNAVFVLHVFQKKSKRGAATPKADIDLIRERLKVVEQMAKELNR
jgi:phage-related protein